MKNKKLIIVVLATLPSIPTVSLADGGPHASRDNNPAVNLVLEGRFGRYDDGHFEIPGFQLVSEEGVYQKGFSIGHNELNIAAKMGSDMFGTFAAAIERHDGQSELGLEEAFIESTGFGHGITVKAGHFFSHIGIYNKIHEHRQSFADVPLVYTAMFNTHLADTGMQLRWHYQSGIHFEAGLETTTGTGFPGGERLDADNNHGRAAFIKLSSGHNDHANWQFGVSHYSSKFDHRAGGHHDEGGLEIHDGTTDITGVDFSFTYSPNGHHDNVGQIELQFEYFQRDEEGIAEYADLLDLAEGDYDGDQTGLYLQAVYNLSSKLRVGLRYDVLSADNMLANFDGDVDGDLVALTEEDTGLIAEKDPKRFSVMMDYSPDPLTTLRMQVMNDDSGHKSNDRVYLQYLTSLGGKKH